jgi:hypothetical protein
LSFAIAFVREITRSKSAARVALWDAASQSVDGIGEVYARVVSVIDRPGVGVDGFVVPRDFREFFERDPL